jgi:hypothetical protein
MRFPFGKKVVKRCPKGHEMALEWRSCPRCTGSTTVTETRDILDATVVVGAPPAPGRRPAASVPESLVRLTVTAGARAGETLDLNAGRVKLGKAPKPETDVRLITLDDGYMSRDHAALTVGPAGAVLVDLGSTNGTFVNGARVERALLSEGDEIRLGQTTLLVTRSTSA